MPQEHGAIGGTGSYVTIRSDVTFRSGQTSDHSVVSENNLNDFRGFRRKHAKAVVPKTASNQELAVHGRDETVRSDLQVLAEVVAKVASLHGIGAVVRLGCNRTFIKRHAILLVSVMTYTRRDPWKAEDSLLGFGACPHSWGIEPQQRNLCSNDLQRIVGAWSQLPLKVMVVGDTCWRICGRWESSKGTSSSCKYRLVY